MHGKANIGMFEQIQQSPSSWLVINSANPFFISVDNGFNIPNPLSRITGYIRDKNNEYGRNQLDAFLKGPETKTYLNHNLQLIDKWERELLFSISQTLRNGFRRPGDGRRLKEAVNEGFSYFRNIIKNIEVPLPTNCRMLSTSDNNATRFELPNAKHKDGILNLNIQERNPAKSLSHELMHILDMIPEYNQAMKQKFNFPFRYGLMRETRHPNQLFLYDKLRSMQSGDLYSAKMYPPIPMQYEKGAQLAVPNNNPDSRYPHIFTSRNIPSELRQAAKNIIQNPVGSDYATQLFENYLTGNPTPLTYTLPILRLLKKLRQTRGR